MNEIKELLKMKDAHYQLGMEIRDKEMSIIPMLIKEMPEAISVNWQKVAARLDMPYHGRQIRRR